MQDLKKATPNELIDNNKGNNYSSQKRAKVITSQIDPLIKKTKQLNQDIAKLESIKFSQIITSQLNGLGGLKSTKSAREQLIKEIYKRFSKEEIDINGLRYLLKNISVELEYRIVNKSIKSPEQANSFLKNILSSFRQIDFTESNKFKITNQSLKN